MLTGGDIRMPPTNPSPFPPPLLYGRARERALLDRLVNDVREGTSAVLVVSGEAGVGNTALLDYLAREAAGFRVVRIAGTEAESALPYAGLHQLCGPMLDQIQLLPEPQAAAISIALGRAAGDHPDRLLVALATLGLVTASSADGPLMCVVDDAHWLDDDSMQVVGFVARRLAAGPVGIVCALREPFDQRDLVGLPELHVRGLVPGDAQVLLSSLVPGPIDPDVRDRIVDESRGNPLALRELAGTPSAAEFAGGFALPPAAIAPPHIEREMLQLLTALPAETRLLLVLVSADPVGEPAVIWRAIDRLGISRDAAFAAVDAALIDLDGKVRFQRPLMRSVAYRSASPQQRQAAHRALAEAFDGAADLDWRAWHLGQATVEPAEPVSATLERSAAQAGRRAGLAATAAFLERAAGLTPQRSSRAARIVAAASAKRDAGAVEAAARLVSAIEPDDLDELARAPRSASGADRV